MRFSYNIQDKKARTLQHQGHSQLQQRPIRIAVGKLLVALLLEVALERTNGLGVVALEAIDDGSDVVGPFRGIFAVHLGLYLRGI